jgi:hypothetical protein
MLRPHTPALAFAGATLLALASGCGGGGGGGAADGGTTTAGGGISGNINGSWMVASGTDAEDPKFIVVRDGSAGGDLIIGRYSSSLADISAYSRGVTITGGAFTYTYPVSGIDRTYHVTAMNDSSLSGTRTVGSTTGPLAGGNNFKPAPLADSMQGAYEFDDGSFNIALKKSGSAWTVADASTATLTYVPATVTGENVIKATLPGGDKIIFFVTSDIDQDAHGFYIDNPGASQEVVPLEGHWVTSSGI